MVAYAALRKARAAKDFLNAVWQGARGASLRSGRSCPHCSMPMATVVVPSGDLDLALDVCTICSCIWFDPSEYSQLPKATGPAPYPAVTAQPTASTHTPFERPAAAAREPVRAEEARPLGGASREKHHAAGPDEAWKYLPALLGMPVECDQPPVSTRPWVTWGAALIAVIVFVVAWGVDRLASVNGVWGFVPAEWYRLGGLTVATSFFMHGGVWHLVSNMYFLLVFGDNVENDLGGGRFVGLLAGAHFVGMIAHALLDPRSMVPCVGASAGISGVIAYYALAFPRARLGFMVFLRWFRMTAAVAFQLWMGLQFLLAWQQVAGFGSASALAHLGGAAVGLLAAFVLRKRRRDTLEPSRARRGADEPVRWTHPDVRARAPATWGSARLQ